jgi:hypothetical protein
MHVDHHGYFLPKATRQLNPAAVGCKVWDPDSNELAVEAVRAYPYRFAIITEPSWVPGMTCVIKIIVHF